MPFDFISVNSIISQGENQKFMDTVKDLEGFLKVVGGKQRN